VNVIPWQQRIRRAEELARQRPFAAEFLGFYVSLARFQENLYRQLSAILPRRPPSASINDELSPVELSELTARFEAFLPWLEAHGPQQSAALSHELRVLGSRFWSDLLQGAWRSRSTSDARSLLAEAFLQPYAELLRSSVDPHLFQSAPALCPCCGHKPVVGVLRPKGEGSARSLVCSFCLSEWEFRRVVCAGCGEENDQKLPVFTASDFDYIRVEGCETCKIYLKTVDLTRNGLAEPVVDELASAPLDFWALDHGYAKLHANILGF